MECERKYKTETEGLSTSAVEVDRAKKVANAVVSPPDVLPCRARAANCCRRGIVRLRRLHPSAAPDATSCTVKNIGSGGRRAHRRYRSRGE